MKTREWIRMWQKEIIKLIQLKERNNAFPLHVREWLEKNVMEIKFEKANLNNNNK